MIRTIRETNRERQGWKGTVLLVGLMALLALVNGCYTVLATGGAAHHSLDDYRTAEVPFASTQPPDYAQAEEVQWIEEPYYSGSSLGVRYRLDSGVSEAYLLEPAATYDYYSAEQVFPGAYRHRGYRRAWVRRAHVDWYLYNAYRYHPWPRRVHFGWSVGVRWSGFTVGWGYASPYWNDPFYWDYWWTDPFWPRQPIYCYTYDPWYDAVVRVHWTSSWWDPWYDPWYSPWGGGFWGGGFHYSIWRPWYADYGWYGPYRPSVVVVRDAARRPFERARGIAETRVARGQAAGLPGTAVAADDPRSTTRTEARTPRTTGGGTVTGRGTTGRTVPAGTSTGGTSARVPRTGTTGSAGVPPSVSPPPRTASPPPEITARTQTGSRMTLGRVLGELGGRIVREIAGVSEPPERRTTETSKATRTPTTTARPPSSTTARPPSTTSRPPSTTSRPPVTTARPPSTTSRPPSTTSRPPSTTSRPPSTTSRPPSTTARPPSTTSRPPVTTARPPVTTARPPSTTSRPPASSSTPPRTTRPPSQP